MRPVAAITAQGPESCRRGHGSGSAHGPGPVASSSPLPAAAANANAAAAPRPSARRRQDQQQQHQQHQDNTTKGDNENPSSSSTLPKPAFPSNRPPGPFPPDPSKPWLLLALTPLPPLPLPPPSGPRPFFRYWVDSQALSSAASTVLLERALMALGGRRTGGPPKALAESSEEGGGGRRAARDAAARAAAALLLNGRSGGGGSPPSTTPPPPTPPRVYGYMHMGEWDFLWSITAKAMLAAELLRPGQLVSVVPGCLSISRKTSLVRSLSQAYGKEVAFSVVPLTFKLPEELDAWARALEREGGEMRGVAEAAAQAGSGQGRDRRPAHQQPPETPHAASLPLWMLKNNKQRGTGLRLVPGGPRAFRTAFETAYRPGKMAGLPLYRWYLAQRYVGDPLLLRPYGGSADWVVAQPPPPRGKNKGEEDKKEEAQKEKEKPPPLDNRPRKFGLRLWALVPSAAPPFRAYVHTRGLALFSSRAYTSDPWPTAQGQGGEGEEAASAAAAPAPSPPPPVPEGHLTNAARNAGAPVWPLSRVAGALGPQAWRELWEQLCRSTALALAASRGRVRELKRELDLPRGGAFQLFGLDFVVDASLRPWLLEVNATPSMRVDHPCPASAAVVEGEKWPAVWDALAVLRVAPERFAGAHGSSSSASEASAAGAAAGGGNGGASSSSSQRSRRWPFFGRRGGRHHDGAAGAAGGSGRGKGGGGAGAADAPEASVADVAAEMRRAGGYVPLTHLFPDAETLPGCSVPWTAADDALRTWLRREEGEERRRRGGGGAAPFSWHAWA